MSYLLRTKKEVIRKLEDPYVVFDSEHSVLLKIGEKKEMEEYFDLATRSYRSYGYDSQADVICLMELPKDQEEIDKVFNICDYVGRLYERNLANVKFA